MFFRRKTSGTIPYVLNNVYKKVLNFSQISFVSVKTVAFRNCNFFVTAAAFICKEMAFGGPEVFRLWPPPHLSAKYNLTDSLLSLVTKFLCLTYLFQFLSLFTFKNILQRDFFESTAYLKIAKLQYVSSGFRCRIITGSLMRL